jgi:molecular chaperone GrpE (heat shock protein)
MTAITIPLSMQIGMDEVCSLCTQSWRLKRLGEKADDGNFASGLRYAARQLNEILRRIEIEAVDLSGQPYDPGMAPEVLEIHDDPTLPPDSSLIHETIAPTITWRGNVVRPGQIIVRRSISATAENESVNE